MGTAEGVARVGDEEGALGAHVVDAEVVMVVVVDAAAGADADEAVVDTQAWGSVVRGHPGWCHPVEVFGQRPHAPVELHIGNTFIFYIRVYILLLVSANCALGAGELLGKALYCRRR